MEETLSKDQQFLKKLTDIVIANLQNENFGVRELAMESGMSLYRLSRRLYSITTKTSNQFIREIRLKKAFDMLQEETYTVAEVAYKTGFGSPNYFHKCFHGYYGYPPGKVLKGYPVSNEQTDLNRADDNNKQKRPLIISSVLSFHGILYIAILSVIIGLFLYRMIHKNEWSDGLTSKEGKITLAVMPFRNLTNDTLLNYWKEGIQTSIINFLTNSDERLVSISVNELIQSKALVEYSSLTPSLEIDLAKRMDVDVFISGSVIQAGSSLIVNVLLINTKTGETIKSFEKEVPGSREFVFRAIDTLRHQMRDFLVITKQKKSDPDSRQYFFDPITSAEAYGYMVSATKAGYREDFNTAIKMYEQALLIDSNIYDAYHLIAQAYGKQGNWEDYKKWVLRYYSKYDNLNMYNKLFADYLKAITFETPHEAIRYVRQMIALSDKAPYNFANLGDEYWKLLQYDKAIPEYIRALEIYEKWDTKPPLEYYTFLGSSFHKTGQYRQEKKIYGKAEKDYPGDPYLAQMQAILALTEGDTIAANHFIETYSSCSRENLLSEARIVRGVALLYREAGRLNEAEKYYMLALSMDPENPGMMYSLAYFLIDKDRDVNEGLELIEKVLRYKPDSYNYLHAKGWGLYKLGKLPEAKEVLQKSWDLRMENAKYDHEAFLHLEEAKKAADRQI